MQQHETSWAQKKEFWLYTQKFGHNISGNKEKWVQIVITCYLYPTADDTLSIYVCNYVAIDILTSDALYSEDLLCMIPKKGVLCPNVIKLRGQ